MTGRRDPRRARGEDGVSLIIAMAFLSFLSVLVVSLLSMTFSGVKTTTTVRENNSGLYGADGGADIGVQFLRANSSYCANTAAGTQSLPSQSVGGRTVSISCQALSGSSGGGAVSWPTAWSLIITGYGGLQGNQSFKTSGSTGRSETATFGPAPVFNAGGFSFSGACW